MSKFNYMGGGSPTVTPQQVNEIIVDLFNITFQKELEGLGIISRTEVRAFIHHQLGGLFAELRCFLASKEHTELDERKVIIQPRGWWQAFRSRFLPGWWLRRWPVATETIETRNVKKTVRICPHLPTDDARRHYQWIARNPSEEATEDLGKEFLALRLLRRMSDIAHPESLTFECSPTLQAMAKKILQGEG